MKTTDNNSISDIIKGYFNAIPDKEDEQQTIDQISSDAVFRGSKLWVLIFAIFIASLGLNVNSTAVIIGAMLISPLMGPIIGMGLGIGISDPDLLRRSVKNYLVATAISVLTATLYFVATPLTEAQSELLARTSPTLYDVLIALFGGAAGILALSTKGKGNVIPGVAIATALMPPLCTAGYGLAMGRMAYFFGAFYLFFINTVFICLATFIGVRMLKFKHKQYVDPQRMKKVKHYIIAAVVGTMLPAAYMTVQIIKQSVVENNMLKFMKTEMAFKGTQIISHSIDRKNGMLNVVAVGHAISSADIKKLKARLPQYQLGSYQLNVIQGSVADSTLLDRVMNSVASTNETVSKQLMGQSAQLQQLETQLSHYTRYEELGKEIKGELAALWPTVERVSIAPVTESQKDTTATRQYVIAVVGSSRQMAAIDRLRLQRWLKARTHADSLRLIVTP